MATFRVRREPYDRNSNTVTWVTVEASSREEAEAKELKRWQNNNLDAAMELTHWQNRRRKAAGLPSLFFNMDGRNFK